MFYVLQRMFYVLMKSGILVDLTEILRNEKLSLAGL